MGWGLQPSVECLPNMNEDLGSVNGIGKMEEKQSDVLHISNSAMKG